MPSLFISSILQSPNYKILKKYQLENCGQIFVMKTSYSCTVIGIFRVYVHFDGFWDICAVSIRFMFHRKKWNEACYMTLCFPNVPFMIKRMKSNIDHGFRSSTTLWTIRDVAHMHWMH